MKWINAKIIKTWISILTLITLSIGIIKFVKNDILDFKKEEAQFSTTNVIDSQIDITHNNGIINQNNTVNTTNTYDEYQ